MTYSQSPLLRLLAAGKVSGESGIPKHVETVISNVFLFDEQVYKLYKNDNDFFNKNYHDLSRKEERFAFSTADFEWNHQLAKKVYLRLEGARVDGDSARLLGDKLDDVEEVLLVTKRLPPNDSLFEHLRKKDLTETDYYEIGKQFAEREKGAVFDVDISKESLLENMRGRHADIVGWMRGNKNIPLLEGDGYAGVFKELITDRYGTSAERVSMCMDIHSMNAFYTHKRLYPFDTFSPKDTWRFGPGLLNIYRLATDVFALVGEKEFHSVLHGYNDFLHLAPPSKETERLLVIYSSLIMVPYLYMISESDPDKRETATEYHNFLKQYANS